MLSDANEIIESLKGLDAQSFANDEERVRATKVIQSLLHRLERPVDQWFKMTWQDPAYVSALKIAVDTDLFSKWVADGSSPKTSTELSILCGVEEALLTRLLRHMVAMGGLTQPTLGVYGLTPLTTSLAGNGFKNNVTMLFSDMYPGLLNLPSYLSKNGYREPSDPTSTNWQDLQQKPETYIQWLGAQPSRFEQFHNVMAAYNAATPEWVDLYPTQELVTALKPGRAVLVDIGGSKGGDLLAFQKKHPGLPAGSLILQDLPHIIQALQPLPGITPMVQDIFEAQQVKGARAYFMHFLLHGFNDEQSIKALKNLAAVMEPGYSKVLLHEAVIDELLPAPSATSLDLTMMMTLSGSERTSSSWRKVIGAAGLRVTNVFSIATINESIIEAELA